MQQVFSLHLPHVQPLHVSVANNAIVLFYYKPNEFFSLKQWCAPWICNGNDEVIHSYLSASLSRWFHSVHLSNYTIFIFSFTDSCSVSCPHGTDTPEHCTLFLTVQFFMLSLIQNFDVQPFSS